MALSSIPDTTCGNGTLCFELMKGVPAAIVALSIGIATIGIAIWQYRLARAKLKLDLFDKRFKVYEKVYEGLKKLLRLEPYADYDFTENIFGGSLPEVRFLFGKDIQDYVASILERWVDFANIYERERQNGGVMLTDDLEKFRELSHWAYNESVSIEQRFEKYLSFDRWH